MRHAAYMLILCVSLVLVGCGRSGGEGAAEGRLRVVATTSIVGDVVAQVGGDAIALTVLMSAGDEPHSYQASARDLEAAAEADIIFVNGFGFEAGLLDDLRAAAQGVPIISLSEEIRPLASSEPHEDEEEGHGSGDPHVWFDVANVKAWVRAAESTLSQQDLVNAAAYAANAARYQGELTRLDNDIRAAVAAIPAERRILVTNHDTFQYFARAYGFRVVGVVVPSFSAGIDPSAAQMEALIERIRVTGVTALFVENTANERVAQIVRDETGASLFTLHTDALGPEGSGAESYLGLMRSNVATLQQALGK